MACVYIDLPIGEMKKKAKMSEFIHNLARGRMATACFLPSVVRHGREKKGKAQFKRSSFHVPNLIPVQVDPNVSRLTQASNLKCSRTRFIFRMFNGLECFKQVKVNFTADFIAMYTPGFFQT